MISCIEIHNFLSWEKAVLPIGPLTVIAGANLSGKTCIQRATAWALFNEGTWNANPNLDTIRRMQPDGTLAPEVSVTVTFSDGRKLRRYRNAATNENSYTLTHPDGTIDVIPSGSVGAGFCADVGKFTGFVPISWTGVDEKTNLQFSNDAIDGRFLLSDTTLTADRKLGTVMGIDTIERAVKEAASKATAANRASSKLAQGISTKQQELAAYDDLDVALDAHQTACERVSAAEAASTRLTIAETFVGALTQHTDVLLCIGEGPSLIETAIAGLQQKIASADDAKRKCLTGEELLSRMEGSTGPTDEELMALDTALADSEIAAVQSHEATARWGQADALCRAGAEQSAAIANAAAEIEAINEETEALMAQVTVCPVDGTPHQTCPFYRRDEETL